MSEGILVALQQRIKDLEALEKAHQEKNGMLILGLQQNDEKYKNPIEDLRTKGII